MKIDCNFPWETQPLSRLLTHSVSGVSLGDNDFSDHGFPVAHKGDVRPSGVLDLSPRNSRYVSRESFDLNKRAQVSNEFLVVSLRDLVPAAPQLGLINQIPIDQNAVLLAQGTYGFKVDPSKLNKMFLCQLSAVDFFRSTMKKNAVGSTQKHLRSTEFFELEIPVPPLNEQEKIAKILFTWDKAIKNMEDLIQFKIKRKKALVDVLLSGKKRFSEFGLSFSKGGIIGSDWKEIVLGEVLVEYREKTSSNNQYEVMTSSRQGLVLQSDYYDGENRITNRDNTGFNVIPPKYFTYRSRSDDGSFYFNRNNLGKHGCISTYYPVFRFKDSSDDFFYYLLNRNNKIYEAFSVGTSQKVLSLNALKGIKFMIPPKEEQEKIAKFLSFLDFEIGLFRSKSEKLILQKQELMQQLLTGKKRVKT